MRPASGRAFGEAAFLTSRLCCSCSAGAAETPSVFANARSAPEEPVVAAPPPGRRALPLSHPGRWDVEDVHGFISSLPGGWGLGALLRPSPTFGLCRYGAASW